MSYMFKDDKTKINMEDMFVIVEDNGYITDLIPNTAKGYIINITDEYGYSSDEYFPLAVTGVDATPEGSFNVSLVTEGERVKISNNKIIASFGIINTATNQVINKVNVNARVLLCRR